MNLKKLVYQPDKATGPYLFYFIGWEKKNLDLNVFISVFLLILKVEKSHRLKINMNEFIALFLLNDLIFG